MPDKSATMNTSKFSRNRYIWLLPILLLSCYCAQAQSTTKPPSQSKEDLLTITPTLALNLPLSSELSELISLGFGPDVRGSYFLTESMRINASIGMISYKDNIRPKEAFRFNLVPMRLGVTYYLTPFLYGGVDMGICIASIRTINYDFFEWSIAASI